MPSNIGSHLLGRRPSTFDARDWKLSDPTKVSLALSLKKPLRKLSWWEAIWRWIVELFFPPVIPAPPMPSPQPPLPQPPSPVPSPSPAPIPPPTSVIWDDPIQLDQGDTPHCVGFGWAAWGDAVPVQDQYRDSDGHAIYYECKIIDGEPDREDGSEVRSGAKAMQNRKRLAAYLFASTNDEVKQWLLNYGPIVIGSDWYTSMFYPDVNGFISPSGGVAGGHCYLCLGYDTETDSFLFQNSWGASWGLNGRFKMKAVDFNNLVFAGNGEACAAVELPL